MLTFEGFKSWMDRYGQVCEDRDPEAAAGLFTEDAEYIETPFDEPRVGRAAIYRYWSEAAQALKESQFTYEILAVNGDLGIARWQGVITSVKTGARIALDGVFLVDMNEDGKCSRFREWWHRREIEDQGLNYNMP